MSKKVNKAIFSMVAGRTPTELEMREVRKLLESVPRNNPLWNCSAGGICAAIFGAILEVSDKVRQTSISTVEACVNSIPISVREDICVRFEDLERILDCSEKSVSALYVNYWPRKEGRPRTNPLTYEQRHLDYKMRQKKVMKRQRFAEA